MQSVKTLEIITKRGFRLHAFINDAITREIQKKGEYDANTLDSLSDILAFIKPSISLDVGANIGNHAMVIASFSRRVIAFEPIKFIFDVLEINKNANALNHLEVVNVGLSNSHALSDICVPNNGNFGSSSLEIKPDHGTLLSIKTVVGDDFLEAKMINDHVDFIKMDVEGHEPFALLGLKKTILRDQPLILLEWKSEQTIAQFKEFDLFNHLFTGYSFHALTYTTNKKIHENNFKGFFTRIFYRLKGKRWCLTRFDATKKYTNVYFVPARFKSKVQNFIEFTQKV